MNNNKNLMIILGVVAVIVILLLVNRPQPQAAWLTDVFKVPCLSYNEALQIATDKEATTVYTALIVKLPQGKWASCTDSNMMGFDANKLWAVKVGHAYDFETNRGVLDTRCEIDADCDIFEGARLDDDDVYFNGITGTFPNKMLCIDGKCNSYYTGCGPGDLNCDGCVSDNEIPSAIDSWIKQLGISDAEIPVIITKWIKQEGC